MKDIITAVLTERKSNQKTYLKNKQKSRFFKK